MREVGTNWIVLFVTKPRFGWGEERVVTTRVKFPWPVTEDQVRREIDSRPNVERFVTAIACPEMAA